MKTILMIASCDTSISTSLSNVLHEIKSDNIDHLSTRFSSRFSLKQSNSFKLRQTFAKFKAIILSRVYQLVRKLPVCDFFASSTSSDDISFVYVLSHVSYVNGFTNENLCEFMQVCASSWEFA